jgi:hypothetical protein
MRRARSSRHHVVTVSGTGSPTLTVATQKVAQWAISTSTMASDDGSVR